MLERPSLESAVHAALSRSPAVALVGPRQVGKTTLARTLIASNSPNWFDLENPQVEAQLRTPMVALQDLRGLVVIDEVQHAPDLFKVLRVLIDRPGKLASFLLLGSASPSLLRQSSESLAGRIELIEAGGFTLDETGAAHVSALWWRGGFPRSYTARDDAASRIWRREFIRTVVERDLPQLGMNVAAPAIYRFWSMLLTGNYRCITLHEPQAIRDAVHGDLKLSQSIYEHVDGIARRLGADPEDQVPFAKYAKAAESLLKPSSAARAVAAGAPFIERVDLLVKLISHHLDAPNAEIDRTVQIVDQKLNEKIVGGGSGAS